MIGGGHPLLRENLADTDPLPCKKPIFNPFSIVLQAYCVTLVEDRPIVCRISSSTFGHNCPTLQFGLSAIAELLVHSFIHLFVSDIAYDIKSLSRKIRTNATSYKATVGL